MNNLQTKISLSAKILLIWMTCIFGVTGILFLFGISISVVNLILASVVTVIICIKCISSPELKNYQVWCMALAVFIITVCMSMSVYDHTWDGAAYHKQAIGLLKEGWNPAYMLSNDFCKSSLSVVNIKDGPLLWAESYPKATWYCAALIYLITGNIESGKFYTLLFSYIAFGITWDYFKKKNISKIAQILLSLLVAFNPIVCAQVQSYYLDGVVACVLSMLIFIFLNIIENKQEVSKEQWVILGSLIIWGCNLKFSVVLYVVTFCAVFCVLRLIQNKKNAILDSVIIFIEGVVAVFVCGFAPYVTNIIRHGSMFYSMNGLTSEERMQSEYGVLGIGKAGRFLVSLFARTSHGNYNSLDALLKIPFTYAEEEIIYYSIPDVRIGGFGIFFSGLLLIAIAITFVTVVIYVKKRKITLVNVFIISVVIITFLECCVIPQTNQFRYVPHVYLYIVLASYLLATYARKKNVMKVIMAVYCLFAMLNLMPWVNVWNQNINNGLMTTAALKGMEYSCEEEDKVYEISFYCDDWTGIYYNLKDYNIKYKYKSLAELGPEYNSTFYNWMYYK